MGGLCSGKNKPEEQKKLPEEPIVEPVVHPKERINQQDENLSQLQSQFEELVKALQQMTDGFTLITKQLTLNKEITE